MCSITNKKDVKAKKKTKKYQNDRETTGATQNAKQKYENNTNYTNRKYKTLHQKTYKNMHTVGTN